MDWIHNPKIILASSGKEFPLFKCSVDYFEHYIKAVGFNLGTLCKAVV